MEQNFLILTLATASVGFMIWYALSSSLRLPVRYQIMYDANPPYVNRIFRRRILGAFIYAIIPIFIIRCTKLLGKPTLADLGISFQWNKEVAMYTFGGLILVLLISLLTTKNHTSLEMYPEVRVRFWRPNILIFSALWWILYIVAYEFFYRGLLLQSLLLTTNNEVIAIAGSTALYALSHYFKLNRVTTSSVFYGAVASYVVLKTGSLIAPIVSHLGLCLFTEWLSIKHHREMFIRKT